MPIHDWTRVEAGTFHDFHFSWIYQIRSRLNAGLLPDGFYAQAEQIIGPMGPDVLALERIKPDDNLLPNDTHSGNVSGTILLKSPPRVKLVAESESEKYGDKRKTIVIRHHSGNRIVALIEIMSPGNKASQRAMTKFVNKAVQALVSGYHLLIVDLFPPTNRDPQGIHQTIWNEIEDTEFLMPEDEPLTLASYESGYLKRAYVETTAVGRALIDMPLFLEEDGYVDVPLESTYQAAFREVPAFVRKILDQG